MRGIETIPVKERIVLFPSMVLEYGHYDGDPTRPIYNIFLKRVGKIEIDIDYIKDLWYPIPEYVFAQALHGKEMDMYYVGFCHSWEIYEKFYTPLTNRLDGNSLENWLYERQYSNLIRITDRIGFDFV